MLNILCKDELENFRLVILEGELSSNTCTVLNDNIKMLNESSSTNIVLDFSDLTYLSSAGLRSLILIFKDLSLNNKKLIILNPSSLVSEVLRVSGFVKLIPVCKTLEEAKELVK